jgi:hypothetical protein
MDLNSIIIDIFTGKKPDITFDIFLTKISKYTNTLSWKEKQINDKHLYLFFHDWNAKNNIPESNNNSQHFITKYFNNLIIDTDFNIIMYNGPKIYDSIRDKFNLTDIIQLTENKIDECIINEATEGTNINVLLYRSMVFYNKTNI